MTDSDERLEDTDVWPNVLASINAGKPPTEVAAEFGVTAAAIKGGLRRTGGGAGRRRIVRKPASPAEDEVSTEKDTGFKRRSRPSPALERVAEHQDLVGAVPDAVVAERAGVSIGTVRNYRRANGIPGAPRSARKRGKRPAKGDASPVATRSSNRKVEAGRTRKSKPTPSQDKVREHHDLVGASPDHVVAELAGVSVGTVRNYRMAHGIPGAPRSTWANASTATARDTERLPESSAETPSELQERERPRQLTPARGPTTLHAWKVRFGWGQERVAIGASLADVAEQADRAGLGSVTSMERIGIVFPDVTAVD